LRGVAGKCENDISGYSLESETEFGKKKEFPLGFILIIVAVVVVGRLVTGIVMLLKKKSGLLQQSNTTRRRLRPRM